MEIGMEMSNFQESLMRNATTGRGKNFPGRKKLYPNSDLVTYKFEDVRTNGKLFGKSLNFFKVRCDTQI